MLEGEISRRDELLSHSQTDLVSAREDLTRRGEDSDRLETNIRQLKVELSNLDRDYRQAQTIVSTGARH